MRCFLAIPVLAPALDAYLELRGRLNDDVPAVRWAPADSAHITLHFFGAISPADAARALDGLRPVVAACPAMSLRLRGLGSFPPRGPARVLWCGVDGDVAALSSLAQACASVLRERWFPVEERTYRPHCTLGRPRQPWPGVALEQWSRHAHAVPETPAFNAHRAVLYESTTRDGRTVHVPRDALPLAGG